MGVFYEYTGVVKEVCEVQKFDSGFTKQELIVTDDIGQTPRFPNMLCFTFKKERIEKLVGVSAGQRVKITFAIDGREWENGYHKKCHSNDLTALKIDILAGGIEPKEEPKTDEAEAAAEPTSEELPF